MITRIPKVPDWIVALGLLVLTLVVYAPSTQCGFIWDDSFYVEKNKTLDSHDGLQKIWFDLHATPDYYPLTFTSFWFERRLWQVRPLGYHLINNLLHAINAVVLWRLLLRIGVPGALLGALLFAVHPIHVDSVSWITERKNVLSGLFCLLSLHAFVSFIPLDHTVEMNAQRRWTYYSLSVAAFLLAMLAKTAVIPLPLIMPVLVWWKRGRLKLSELLAVAPYFVVAFPLFYVASLGESNFAGAGVNIIAAEGGDWNLSFLERLLLCGRVLWFYVAKLLWPHPLMFVYPRWRIDCQAWWQYLYPLAAVAVPVCLWLLRHRIGRGPLAAALVFGLMLAPASGFFNFYFQRFSYVQDHLQYFAGIAVTTLLAAIATQAFKYCRMHWVWGTWLTLVGVCVLATLTWRHQAAYCNDHALWTDTVDKNPHSWLAHNNLAAILEPIGLIAESVEHSRLALQDNPNDYLTHFNLGNGMRHLQRMDEAVAYYQSSIRLAPNFIQARNNLGTTLLRLGRVEEAGEQYHLMLAIDPNNFKAHNGLGIVMMQQNRIKEAIEAFRAALRLQPDSIEAQNNLRRAQMYSARNNED